MPDSGWPEEVRAWWAEVWTHPVSATWDRVADGNAVARLAGLYAREQRGEEITAATLAQIVKLEIELGLTPAARLRQHHRLPDPQHDRESQPRFRANLRVVEGPDPRDVWRDGS